MATSSTLSQQGRRRGSPLLVTKNENQQDDDKDNKDPALSLSLSSSWLCDGSNGDDSGNGLLFGCRDYLVHCVWPGLGLFGESYLLFSIGTLQPLWEAMLPLCFATQQDTTTTCTAHQLYGLQYGTVCGIILGMLVVGATATTLGRRRGSILTAALMTMGAAGLTLVALTTTTTETNDNNNQDSHDWNVVTQMTVCFFLFGIGVGGEYPLSASSASESTMTKTTTHNNNNNNNATTKARGRRIQLVFSMQGMGIFCHCLVLSALLWLMGGQTTSDNDDDDNNNNHTYDTQALLRIWQIIYAVGFVVLLTVLVTRCLYLQESAAWQADQDQRDNHNPDPNGLRQPSSSSCLAVTPPAVQDDNKNNTDNDNMVPTTNFVSVQSDVSSLSAPSLAAVEFVDETSTGGAYLMVLKEESSDDCRRRRRHEQAHWPAWRHLVHHFGVRLLGVSACWFLWDVAFYGNKLFQSAFLLALAGQQQQQQQKDKEDDDYHVSLLAFSLAATLNAAVALSGYFGAALVLDRVGRRTLQMWGFCLTGTLFVACGFFYNSLDSNILVLLYLGSSFFGQLGPNATTFGLPAEIFPTQVRTTCHGIAAAAGKAGALAAALLFPMLHSDLDLFLISGYASLAAAVLTFYTIPETAGLDLHELDIKWRYIQAGRRQDYHGPANQVAYLSYYERMKWSLEQATQSTADDHYNHAMDDY